MVSDIYIVTEVSDIYITTQVSEVNIVTEVSEIYIVSEVSRSEGRFHGRVIQEVKNNDDEGFLYR